MKKFLKILFSIITIVALILTVYALSLFSNFYNNLNHIGIGKVFLQDIIVLSITIFILILIPTTIFRIRSSISLKSFSKTIEITENHKKFLLIFDIVGAIIVLIFLILNFREIYLFLNITNWNEFNFIDYPFVIRFMKFLIEYTVFVAFYTLLPILYFSHKSYLIRFLGLSIVPHRVPISLLISIILFLLILSISVILYTFVLSLDLYPSYSLILTIGIITFVSLLIYSIGVSINFLRNSKIPWYDNIAPIILIIIFVLSTIFSKSLPDVSLIKLDLIEKIHSSQISSKYVIKVNRGNVSDIINRIELSKLENLKKVSINEYYFETPNTTIKIIRKPKIFERLYLMVSSGILDKYLQGDVYITNYINIQELAENLLPISFVFSSRVNNTNYLEISFPYEFDQEIFFYKRYTIVWTSEADIRVISQKDINHTVKNIFSSREYFLINNKLKLKNALYSLFFVNSPNFGEYYVISTFGESITVSNSIYTSFRVSEYNEGELFLLVDDIPLFLSNITFENRKVGMKVRYFDIEGRGGEINESISNLIGNAIYYYKVVELTNKIERLKRYLDQHKEDIPPDVFEKLKQFISN